MRRSTALLAAGVVLACAPPGCGGSGPSSAPAGVDAATLSRGEYLVRYVAACGECHTPRDEDGNLDQSHWLAGVADRFDLTPDDDTTGSVSTANLTPANLAGHPDDAILAAFLDGVGLDGSPLFPLMPYYAYHNMTAADAKAVVAYLRTVPSIASDIPPRQPLPVPLTSPAPPIAEGAIPHTTLASSDPHYASAERGRYLAGEIGFCLDCHTPWRLGITPPLDLSRVFTGGRPFSAKDWGIPSPSPAVVYSTNVTPDPTGIAGWTAQRIVEVLADGASAHGGSVCRPMPAGPFGSFGGMLPDDASDIGVYLTTLAPVAGEDAPACEAGGL